MEELIRQAFLDVDVIGPHVHEGHYDLMGPDGDIILPQVWEAYIEPDMSITMHMWPMPEPASSRSAPWPGNRAPFPPLRWPSGLTGAPPSPPPPPPAN
jgi:hypothetical protein